MFEITYEGPATIQANQLFHATISITVNQQICPGGRIALACRHVSDIGEAQMDNPAEENYVPVSSNRSGLLWELDVSPWYRHPWNTGFDLVLKEGAVEPGDTVTITLGGERGFRSQSFVERKFIFRIGIQSAPDGEWQVLKPKECPGFEVVGAAQACLRVRVPDVNSTSGKRSVCLKLEDTYGNPVKNEEREISLLLDDKKKIGAVRVDGGMVEVKDVALPADGAWHRITAAADDGNFFARSNPFGPSLVEGYNLYWGEIHCQSGLCDGTNSPAYLYTYGREAAGLDFASVTSHDMLLTPEDWKEITRTTKESHRPGEYVTFLGCEWSGTTDRGGDNNVYFLKDEGPLLYNGACTLQGISHPAWEEAHAYIDKTRTIADVIAELGHRKALIIPHCGGRIANFDFYNPAFMPVFEIHSCHRTYEDVACEAIRRGLKFGFVGGSDDHRGELGDSVPTARERFYSVRCGLMAVYARELTRESLWEAILAKRVYATNGCRSLLNFSINGALMGSEVSVSAGDEINIAFEIVTDGFFDHAELVRNTETIAYFSESRNQITHFKDTFTDKACKGTSAYYLRVYELNGGVSWSSPVWVEGE